MTTSSVNPNGESAITDRVRGWDGYNMTINWKEANTFVKHCVVEITELIAMPTTTTTTTTTTTPNGNEMAEEETEDNAVERAGESV